jgi:hypothetical protein
VTLIDTEAAALILRITPRQTRNLIHQGTLTNHGKRWRILLDPDEVELLRRQRHFYRMARWWENSA